MNFDELPDDIQNEIKNKLFKASKALQEVEDLIKTTGIKIPEDNVKLPEKFVLKLPRGYIRTLGVISKKYKLDLLDDKTLSKNISYAIQYTDFINYILNRTNLGEGGLSVGALFRKHAIINVMTIVEGILIGMVEKTYLKCSRCKDFGVNCSIKIALVYSKYRKYLDDHMNCKKSLDFFWILEYLKKATIIESSEYDELNELRSYRNHIHIQYIDRKTKRRQRDFLEENYSLVNYNNAIRSLHNVTNIIDRFHAMCPNFNN